MSLPKIKSRPITVNDIDFRYIISTSLIDDDCNYKLNVIIQIAEGDGAALAVKGLVTRDSWLDFSDPPRNMINYPVVLPNHIEKFIRKGIEEGWNPQQKGPEFSLELDNKLVFK